MQSKVGQIASLLDGLHCMGTNGLLDYHTARAVRDSGRIKDPEQKASKIRGLLKNYHVLVSFSGVPGDTIRIYSPIKQSEVRI